VKLFLTILALSLTTAVSASADPSPKTGTSTASNGLADYTSFIISGNREVAIDVVGKQGGKLVCYMLIPHTNGKFEDGKNTYEHVCHLRFTPTKDGVYTLAVRADGNTTVDYTWMVK
jgi:hypothetical protein